MDKKQARLRRARKTRAKIAELKVVRLCVHRSNSHIYAQIIDGGNAQGAGGRLDGRGDVRKQAPSGGNVKAAALVGKLIAERAKAAGIETVAFDRSGFMYHGRVKALAEAAREGGLKF
jgi:large subunit ribosomal protein L18